MENVFLVLRSLRVKLLVKGDRRMPDQGRHDARQASWLPCNMFKSLQVNRFAQNGTVKDTESRCRRWGGNVAADKVCCTRRRMVMTKVTAGSHECV